MGRFRFDPERSRLDVHASSSLHGIDTGASGVDGELELDVTGGGAVDLDRPVRASLTFALERLRSGNPLEDVATERAIELSRHPVVDGVLTTIAAGDEPGTYVVAGELTFHGQTRSIEGTVALRVDDDGAVVLEGEQVLDVRDWGVKPPRLGLLKVHPDIRVRLQVVAPPA